MQLTDVPNVVLVASGKGGVGKTTVASDLARKARDMGHTVGLIDADISTPNSPEVVGGEEQDLSDQRLADSHALIPPVVNGIQIISQGVVLPDDVPVLRDGEWRAEAVADYIENVDWDDDTDVVFIDSPPGTGEELQVVAGAAFPDLGVVVTTPHPSALRDARKTHEFFDQADIYHKTVLNMAEIPGQNVAAHVTDNVDLTQVEQVGEERAAEIADLMAEQTPDMPLFAFSEDHIEDYPADFEAVIPYSSAYEKRAAAVEPLLDDYFTPLEVDA